MAVTGLRPCLFALAAPLFLLTLPAHSDGPPPDILAPVNVITRALADDNAPAAMTPFSKSLRDYARLQEYFGGLANRGQIVSEVDVNDGSCSATECKATLTWTMTITNNEWTGDTERRTAVIHMRSTRDHDVWKIVEFAPVEFFNPAERSQRSK